MVCKGKTLCPSKRSIGWMCSYCTLPSWNCHPCRTQLPIVSHLGWILRKIFEACKHWIENNYAGRVGRSDVPLARKQQRILRSWDTLAKKAWYIIVACRFHALATIARTYQPRQQIVHTETDYRRSCWLVRCLWWPALPLWINTLTQCQTK